MAFYPMLMLRMLSAVNLSIGKYFRFRCNVNFQFFQIMKVIIMYLQRGYIIMNHETESYIL